MQETTPSPKIARKISIFAIALGVSMTQAFGRMEPPPPAVEMDYWDGPFGLALEGPPACTPYILKLWNENLSTYLGAAMRNDRRSARKAVEGVRTLLKAIDESDPCYSWVTGYYAVRSVALLGLLPREFEGQTSLMTELRGEGVGLFAIVRELFRQRRLVPMTAELRREWGGAWNDPKAKIIGAYQCEEGIVYFDPRIAPYDLAGVLAHEIDHAVRDKFGYADGADSAEDKTPVSVSLLLDEALASLHAGYAQLSYRKDVNRTTKRRDGWYIGGKIRVSSDRTHFYGNVPDDFKLYDPHGNLAALWKDRLDRSELPIEYPFSSFMDDLLRNEPDQRTKLRRIVGIVSKGYFGDEGPSVERTMEELAYWVDRYPSRISALDRHENAGKENAIAFAEKLVHRMESPSAVCAATSAAIRRGEAPGYLGAGDSKPGARPGGEGGRTDGEKVRAAAPIAPCLKPDGGF